jgi:hypothetical protein
VNKAFFVPNEKASVKSQGKKTPHSEQMDYYKAGIPKLAFLITVMKNVLLLNDHNLSSSFVGSKKVL